MFGVDNVISATALPPILINMENCLMCDCVSSRPHKKVRGTAPGRNEIKVMV